MKITQRGCPRPVFEIFATPDELRNLADQMDAMAANGNTLPGQVISVPWQHRFDIKWDPVITVDNFAKRVYSGRMQQMVQRNRLEAADKAEGVDNAPA